MAMMTFLNKSVWLPLLLSVQMGAAFAMTSISETELGDVSAQGLFWSDKITGSELAGANVYSTPFNFYRVGLDGELALNVNIGKTQLGCGGVNDFLGAKAGCDIDIDYAALMGRSGTAVGNPLSAFVLKRPYIELAIKNDGNPVQREVVGLKIGAQSADGAITAGRRYEAGQTNQENMLANGCTGVSTGAGALGCHSGINSVSGFLGADMSLSMGVRATILGLPLLAMGCTGHTAYTGRDEACGNTRNDALFVDLAGTRMQTMGLTNAKLKLSDASLAGVDCIFGICVADILSTATASLNADLRLVHKLTLENTNDFFLSFQREAVAYPRYSKLTPIEEMTRNGTINTAYDACAVTASRTQRCNSAYAVPANTGWWMNLPSVKLLDVYNPEANIGSVSVAEAITLLGPPGFQINQAEFNLTPGKNCYGTTRFC